LPQTHKCQVQLVQKWLVKKASKHISEQYSWFRKALAMIASNAQCRMQLVQKGVGEEGVKEHYWAV
jgi:hypothetical protein